MSLVPFLLTLLEDARSKAIERRCIRSASGPSFHGRCPAIFVCVQGLQLLLVDVLVDVVLNTPSTIFVCVQGLQLLLVDVLGSLHIWSVIASGVLRV
jgi:hypothetical protein